MQGSPQVLKIAGFECLALTPERDPPAKIILLLHGYGRDASLMQKLADEIAGKLPQALIVMPHAPEAFEAPDSDHGNLLRVPEQLRADDPEDSSPRARRQWFSIRAASLKDLAAGLARASEGVNRLITELCGQYQLADRDVAVMGFSQGGGVALFTAYMREQDLACAVGHSTIFIESPHYKSAPPTLYLYGEEDEEFDDRHYGPGAAAVKAYAANATIMSLPGLRHTTSTESRTIVADFIVRHLI